MRDPDPLEEREDAEVRLQQKRIVEQIDEENEVTQLAALLESDAVRDYLWRVVSRCGILTEGFDNNFGRTGYNLGRHSVGRMIIADISVANPKAWLEMQLKAGEQAQKQARETVRARLLRGRSPSANP